MVLQVQKCRCHSCSEVVRHSNYFSAKLYVLVGCDQWDNLVFALICGDNKNTVVIIESDCPKTVSAGKWMKAG